MSSDPQEGIREQPRPAETPIPSTPVTPSEAGSGGPSQDDRGLALACHIGGLFTWFLVPLIIYQGHKDRSAFVRAHALEALNFQIALTIYYFVGCMTLVLWIPVLIFEIIVVVQGCIAANRGEPYRIPLNIRFIS